MRNIIKIKRVWALLLATAICLSSAQARQQQAPPTPPSAPIPSASGQDSSQGPVSPIAAPITTVTGGFAPSVGGAGSAQSQFSSGLYVSEQADSNVQGSSAISAWQPITDFGGHFSLQRMKANSTLVIRYSGGAQIDPLNSQFDNSFHQIEANQIIQFRRWTLSLDDLFGYFTRIVIRIFWRWRGRFVTFGHDFYRSKCSAKPDHSHAVWRADQQYGIGSDPG